MRPFQAVRILSSSPGRTRLPRSARSLARAASSRRPGPLLGIAGLACDLRERDEGMQVPGALEIRVAIEAEAAREHAVLVGGEQPLDFVAPPDVELALVPLGVGVERGVEGAARVRASP